MKRIIGILALTACLAVTAAGQDYKEIPFGEGDWANLQVGEYGGSLVIGSLEGPKTFNHHVAQETSSTDITSMLHAGLIEINPVTNEVEPGLAKSWDISADGLTITFYLREGLQFSDGEPFNADDVIFTYEGVILNEDVRTDSRDVLPDGFAVNKVDDYTVEVSVLSVYRPFLRNMGHAIYPKHVLEDLSRVYNPDADPDALNEAWSIAVDPSEIVGMGAWRLKAFVVDQLVEIERNPYYWKVDPAGNRLPYLDSIQYVISFSLETIFLRFRNAEIDYYAPRPEDLATLIAEAGRKDFDVRIDEDKPLFGTTWIAFNQDCPDENLREAFSMIEFRQAMMHLINKPRIIDDVYLGLAVDQWSPVSQLSPFFYPDVPTFPYDLERAAELLDEIGLVDATGDGWRDFFDGSRFEIELQTNAGNTIREQICQIFVDEAEKVGLRVTFNPIGFNALVTNLLGGQYEAVLLGLTGGVEPHFGANVYPSCGGLHFWKYSDCEDPTPVAQRIDELFDLGVSTFDFNEAYEYYKEFQILFSENLDLHHTVNIVFRVAVYNNLQNTDEFSPVAGPLGFAEYLWKQNPNMVGNRVR